jgi:outer membrane protein TolC
VSCHDDSYYIGQAYAQSAADRAQREAASALKEAAGLRDQLRVDLAQIRAEIAAAHAQLQALREHCDRILKVLTARIGAPQ